MNKINIRRSRNCNMDITNYTKTSNSFLKAEDIIKNPKAVFIITSEGKEVTSEKFGTVRVHIEGEFNREVKTFDLSKTNARFIADKFGSDTNKWIGKVLTLETYKTKTSDGKLVEAINVKEAR